MKRKRIFTLVLMICALFSFSVNGLANTTEQDFIGISPRLSYISSTDTSLSISTSGNASGMAKINGYQGVTTKVETYLYLQQYKNGSWQTVESWSQTDNNYRGTLQGTCSVSKGYNYRVKASYYAYSGSSYENIVDYSGEVSY